jgi:hypothetical protein
VGIHVGLVDDGVAFLGPQGRAHLGPPLRQGAPDATAVEHGRQRDEG